jgi:hypothetical protein
MVREAESIEISSMPEVARLAGEVARSGRPRRLRRGDADVAILTPVRSRRTTSNQDGDHEVGDREQPPKPLRRRRRGALTKDDPLFGLVGIGRSSIPGGISGRKHEYLYRMRHT